MNKLIAEQSFTVVNQIECSEFLMEMEVFFFKKSCVHFLVKYVVRNL